MRAARVGGMLPAMLRAAALALSLAWTGAAGAAEFAVAYRPAEGPRPSNAEIKLTGEIERGDLARLLAIVSDVEASGRQVRNVVLRSPGGSVSEGLLLAREVRRLRLVTGVPRGAECASACFLLFAAGQGKIVREGARVGVHGASVDGLETDAAARATIIMAREVARLGVPPAIIARMAITPPSEMVWLSREELAAMAGQYGHVLQD